MVLVKGKFERDDESARILASEIAPIEHRARAAGHVGGDPRVDAAARPRDVRAALGRARAAQGRPAGGVDIELHEPDRHLRVTVDVNAQIRVRPSERLVSEVEKICGAGSVSLR